MKCYFIPLFSLAFLLVVSCTKQDPFVRVSGSKFTISDKPYYFLGTNFWYGLNLGDPSKPGYRDRLLRELDALKEMGINNLRIMGASEGPDSEPFRMVPSLQTGPGTYNENVAVGLDFLLDEMRKRDMYAVVCLNNFWTWSGGFGQYMVWSKTAMSYMDPGVTGDWDAYQKFVAGFYSDPKAMELFNNHVRYIINRKNTITGITYRDDPTIMAWELANEPRGINNQEPYREWIKNTCAMIKSIDKNHLVTIGSEGRTSSHHAGVDPEADHSFNDVDYVTIHIWVQNWQLYDPAKSDSTLPGAIDFAIKYINDHEAIARKLNKPLVMEEFGISRDENSHDPESPTKVRDEYYTRLFQAVYDKMNEDNSVMAGVNFWAWGGEGRPAVPKGMWKANDDFIGDPPHEPQGWYSVYDKDQSTIDVIKQFAMRINSLPKKE